MKKDSFYRILASGLLLMIYLIAPLRTLQPYIFYHTNFEFIASSLCENKNKPALNCNGKCFLKKELKKSNKEEKEQNAEFSKLFEVNLALTQQIDFLINYTFLLKHLLINSRQPISEGPELYTPPPQI